MSPELFKQAVVAGVVSGLVMAAFVIVFAWSTGATFGQRCEAKGYARYSDDWDACISRLSGVAN